MFRASAKLFRSCVRCVVAACLLVAGSSRAIGQTNVAQTPSALIQSDIASLEANPTPADWIRSHSGEALEPARYGLEYELQGHWCARSIAQIHLSQSVELTRYALFFPLLPRLDQPLPPLPTKLDASLVQQACTLQAFWYVVHDWPHLRDLEDTLSRELGLTEGPPLVLTNPFGHTATIPMRWRPAFTWQYRSTEIQVDEDHSQGVQAPPRPLIRLWNFMNLLAPWSLTLRVPRSIAEVPMFPWNGPPLEAEAAGLAALDPILTGEILRQIMQQPSVRTSPPSPTALDSFERWFRAAENLPPARKAAALVVANSFAESTVRWFPQGFDCATPFGKRLIALGAQFDHCGASLATVYKQNWLQQAQQITTAGPANELARLAPLENVCSFEVTTTSDWIDALIPYGEKFLRDFPASEWYPYVHYLLARTYAEKLAGAYPDPGGYAAQQMRTDSPEAAQLRQAAIDHFRAFLVAKPNAAEAPFAWQEAWRLLADLPPTATHFICERE